MKETQKLNHRQILQDELDRVRQELALSLAENNNLMQRIEQADIRHRESLASSHEAQQKLLLANADLDRLNQEKTQELKTLEGNVSVL